MTTIATTQPNGNHRHMRVIDEEFIASLEGLHIWNSAANHQSNGSVHIPELLSAEHLHLLREKSSISDAVIAARGYFTATRKAALKELGFSDAQCRVSALVLPIHGVTGEVVLHQIRPDNPRSSGDGRTIKYETPREANIALDVPPGVRAKLGNPNTPLFITEGVKKADSAVSHGLACIDLLGVWGFRGGNSDRGKTILADWEFVHLKDREVYIVFDSDVMLNREVYQALVRLKGFLELRKALVKVIYLEPRTDGGKVGLDDFFVAGGVVARLLAQATSTLRTDPGKGQASTLPDIRITTDITAVVDAAESALLSNGSSIFQRLRSLSIIAHDATAPRWMIREPDAPVIVPLEEVQLRERMNQSATWMKFYTRTKEWMPALPPDWAVHTLLKRLQWEFPPLTDIISSPTLRADGVLITKPGYDADTGLFLDTQGIVFPPIPDRPTLDDAVAAVIALREPFADFPFAHDYGFSAILAALGSLVARPTIAGCVPLSAVRATTRASGKGLLIDTAVTIATGRTAPRWPQVLNDDEERKRLLTLGIDGDPCIHIDNVNAPLGSAPLDSALTATSIKDRLLGHNKSLEVPMRAVFFASGNNMVFQGDMARRVVPIDLESLVERPEDRTDFQHTRLLEWVRAERPRLVMQVLTLLRAYFVAGCPKQSITAYGSFEAWSDLVRSALIWAGLPDPCEGRNNIEAESDSGFVALACLLHAWHACYDNRSTTLAAAIQDIQTRAVESPTAVTPPNEWNELHGALAALDDRYDGKRLDSRRIGAALGKIKGRVIDRQRLMPDGTYNRAAKWVVKNV